MIDLSGKRALVVGVANEQSIAYGCAKTFRQCGAELAVTYLNERAEPHVRAATESLDPVIFLPLDVSREGELEAVFDAVREQWGGLEILLHSIAFCPKDDLHGRVVDCSRDGFSLAMDVSCHSFMRMAKLAEPLMQARGGTLMTVTFYGSGMVVENYNVMGTVKAALESATRYMASELGPKGIRVHALSPGPLETRAASGISDFEDMVRLAIHKSPNRALATIEDVGAYAAFLASDLAKSVNGTIPYIDCGYHVID